MSENVDLIRQAATGSAVAQADLVDRVLRHGDAGTIRPLEALIGAELWARMAASQGGVADIRRLGGVLLMRAGFEREHGNTDLAARLDGEALWVLEFAANEGDEDAAAAIVSAAERMPAASFKILPRGCGRVAGKPEAAPR